MLSPHTRFVWKDKLDRVLATWFESDICRTRFRIPESFQAIFRLPEIATQEQLAKAGFTMFGYH